MNLYLTTQLRDSDGNIISEETHESHSFVQQFLKIMMYLWSNNGTIVTDISNTDRFLAYSNPEHYYNYFSGVPIGGTSDYGIVVGTGAGAEANTDYCLGTIISDGVGAGQLDYQTMTLTEAPHTNGAGWETHITRTFINSSGNPITVKEIGWYVTCKDNIGGVRYFMVLRDLETQVVNSGQTLTVTYTFRTVI